MIERPECVVGPMGKEICPLAVRLPRIDADERRFVSACDVLAGELYGGNSGAGAGSTTTYGAPSIAASQDFSRRCWISTWDESEPQSPNMRIFGRAIAPHAGIWQGRDRIVW